MSSEETPPTAIPDALQASDQPSPPQDRLDSTGKRIGNRKNNGGHREGAGLKKGAQLKTKRTYPPEALAQMVTEKLITGKLPKAHHQAGPISEDDRKLISRIANESADAFNERIALELRDVADLATQRIKQKLQNDEFKTSELGFILSVAHDKRLSLDGSRALHQSSINLVVNQFGPTPKDQLLSELDGLSHTKNVTPSQP